MMEKTPDSVMRLRRRGEITWMPEKASGWRPVGNGWCSGSAARRLLVGCDSAWATGTQAGVPTLPGAELALATRVSVLLMRRPARRLFWAERSWGGGGGCWTGGGGGAEGFFWGAGVWG